MFLELPGVLTLQEIHRLRTLAAGAQFTEGRLSNPHSKVKNNLQIDHADPAHAEASNLMVLALRRNEPFHDFAFPHIIAPPMLAKYCAGMNYGVHSDAAFLPVGERPLRSDLSCTIFVADPATYQGGELSIQLGGREIQFKGKPGSAVIYPSNTLHEVKAVTAGERLVGLSFIESQIRDQAQRDILYNLNELAALEGFNITWENRVRLQYVSNNLRRMWGETD